MTDTQAALSPPERGDASPRGSFLPELPWPQRLRAARFAAGVSQGDVADGAGVSRQMVWYWEHGRSNPSPGNLAAVIAYFVAIGIDLGAPEVS